MIKAVFLDRDGTLNPDKKGYIASPSDFELYPFSAKAVKIFTELGFLVFVVTNQSGIARGYYTEEDLQSIHSKMLTQLCDGGAKVEEVLHCPHHPEGVVSGLSKACGCRKPGNLLFRQLQKKYPIKARASFMIGDKPSDIGFGKNSGLQTILVRTGVGEETFQQNLASPDFVVDDLLAAARLVERLCAQASGKYGK